MLLGGCDLPGIVHDVVIVLKKKGLDGRQKLLYTHTSASKGSYLEHRPIQNNPGASRFPLMARRSSHVERWLMFVVVDSSVAVKKLTANFFQRSSNRSKTLVDVDVDVSETEW